jgi:3-hydroxyacyl-[acyl-carrier-protein] dehydratase
MSRTEIETAIPHRPPMLLLDEIVERSDDRIVCKKTFRENEFFFQGHYPGFAIVPGVILCEAAMQSGAVLLSNVVRETGGVPVATRLNDVKFKRMIRPGDTIQIETQLNERVLKAFFLTSKVTCGGKLAASLEFACTMASPVPPAS